VSAGTIQGFGTNFSMSFKNTDNFEVHFPDQPNFVDIVGTIARAPSNKYARLPRTISKDNPKSTFQLGRADDMYVPPLAAVY
jgi:hypothetical protein